MNLTDALDLTTRQLVFVLLSSCVLILYCCKRWLLSEKAKVFYKPTDRNKRLVGSCKTLELDYEYPLWGFSGHIQTFYAQVLRNHQKPIYRREFLKTADGGVIVLDWVNQEKKSVTDPIILILPGICSTGNSHYIRNFARHASTRGFKVVIYIPRGCEDLHTAQIFTLGDTTDLRQTIQHLKKQYDSAPIVPVAFSLGGNVLVNYMGECGKQGQDPLIIGAVTMAQGFDAVWGSEHLRTVPFYDYGMANKLKKLLQRHEKFFSGLVDVPHILKNVYTVEEFDRNFTCKINGFATPRDYYEYHSCKHNMKFVKAPWFMINAKDDPLVIRDMLPLDLPEENENVVMITTERGGHLGWAQGFLLPHDLHWNERTALDCINSLLSHHKSL